ncbi:NAD-binding protein [Pleionea sediminis]|uniref:NAD-binding protein n=1 Tax=Pleionea sediminis TaxID=2569479 RepID=UPI001184A79F|nr:NAD-binding protein [Pleionea sediminis]
MKLQKLSFKQHINWKLWSTLLIFICGYIGFLMGVEVSERANVPEEGLLTKAYYTLGLFVLGGMDIGTPTDGPLAGRILLWLAYFSAPIITVSAIIEAVVNILTPDHLGILRAKNHIIVVGRSDLVPVYLERLRQRNPKSIIVLVIKNAKATEVDELKSLYRVKVIYGDTTHPFILFKLRIPQSKKIYLLDDSDFYNLESFSQIVEKNPGIANKIFIHLADLRLLRSLEKSGNLDTAEIFNSYQTAARTLVNSALLSHFQNTKPKDIIVFAGFGRFGQSILEELQEQASNAFEAVAIIDIDAKRRVMVVDEQNRDAFNYQREVIEGDIKHPEVWHSLFEKMDFSSVEPVFILGTGNDMQNIRTAIWLKSIHPKALVISRTQTPSLFAKSVCESHGIMSINLTELAKVGMPSRT